MSIRSRSLASLLALVVAAHAAGATIDVRARGAVAGDGRDDAPAIQATIDAAAVGDVVAVPAGRFHLARGLRVKGGVRLVGAGRDAATLEWIGGAEEMIVLAGSDTEVAGLLLDGAGRGASAGVFAHATRGHRLHHLRIERLSAADALGIRFTGDAPSAANGVTDSEIADCVIRDIGTTSDWGGGIRLSWGSSRNRILRCVVDGTGRGGIFANDDCTDLVIAGNTVTRSGLHTTRLGIELWGRCHRGLIEDNRIDHWLSLDTSNHCALRRNTVADATGWGFIGIEVITSDAVVTDNLVDGGQDIGLSVSNTADNRHHFYARNVFRGCRQWGCQLYAEGDGIGPLYFHGNTFAATRRGVAGAPYPGADGRGFFCNSGGASSRNLVFEGNAFIDNASTGFYVEGAADRVTAFGNRFIGNAGAGVSSYGGSELDWRGNTVSGNASNAQPASRGFTDRAPTAAFAAPATAAIGQRIAFVNQSSDPDGAIAHSLWDFGAGVPSSQASPTYTFATAGTYRVTLIAWDDRGRAGRAERTIVVGATTGQPPTVALTSPAAGTTVTAPASIAIAATAADDGAIARVEFYAGTTLIATDATAPYATTWTGPGIGTHAITAKAYDDRGQATVSAARTVTVVADGGRGTGLSASYFDAIDLSGAPITRVDHGIDFTWGGGSPDARIAADTFSARWQGEIEARFSEIYTITTVSDDGIRVWIDDRLVIDAWNDHAPRSDRGTVALRAGARVAIRVEYYENGGGAVARLLWASASQPEQIVPETRLHPVAGVVAGGAYRLVARHSGKCLDVSGASPEAGADVQQWDDNGTDAQIWRIDDVGAGAYRLTARCSGHALDVAGSGAGDGANVLQWPWHGGANQRWRIEPVGDGWYRLVCVASGKCLDVAGVSAGTGADVHQWTWVGGANQQWRLEPVAIGIAERAVDEAPLDAGEVSRRPEAQRIYGQSQAVQF
ncbi:MAG TPA: RICIN domain-containing protein [Planctomycetota bacterium]|nr:RICIN domain-containing protein [Planctomycetota bacterium]